MRNQLELLKFQQDIENGIRVAKKTSRWQTDILFGQAQDGLSSPLSVIEKALPIVGSMPEKVMGAAGEKLEFAGGLARTLVPGVGNAFERRQARRTIHFKRAAHRNMMMVERKANFRKRKSVICNSIFKPSDDHYTNDDGSITSVRANCGRERFFIQDNKSLIGYRLIAELEKNSDGLVLFPSSGTGFGRYGTIDAGGASKTPKETVGKGDHYLLPETAAALFGLINKLHSDYSIVVSLGDMSSSNGSDPWQKGFKHHAGHGHKGKRSGMDVDFRYLNTSGKSFQKRNAFGDSSFSAINNQRLYDTAKMYGFTKNYQGTKGSLKGVTKVNGHNDHGHLGLQHKDLKWKYNKKPPVYGKYHWFNHLEFKL